MRGQITYRPVLDLHGMKHEDAEGEVVRFLNDNWNCEEVGTIITGHSADMRQIVFKVLNEHNLQYQWDMLLNSGEVLVRFS